MDTAPNSNMLYSLVFTCLNNSNEVLSNPKQSASLINLMVDQVLANDTTNCKVYNKCKKGVYKDLDDLHKGVDKQRDNVYYYSRNDVGGVSPNTTTGASSDYNEMTENNNWESCTPINQWNSKVLSHFIWRHCLAKFIFLVFLLIACFAHTTPLNGCLQTITTHVNELIMEQTPLSQVGKVTSSYLPQCNHDKYWGLRIEHSDCHLYTLMVYPASLTNYTAQDGAPELYYFIQSYVSSPTMECFESQDYCEAGDEWLWNENVTKPPTGDGPPIIFLEEQNQIVENHRISNQTQISYGNVCLTVLCMSSHLGCPLSMYEDTKCAIELPSTHIKQARDIGSPISPDTLDSIPHNGSCINENWNVIAKDTCTCDAQSQTESMYMVYDIMPGFDPQNYSKSLPFLMRGIQNLGTHTKDWFKELVSQQFEVNLSCLICAHNFMQGELSMNRSINYPLPLSSCPLKNCYILKFNLVTLLAILFLTKVLLPISQVMRHSKPACHTRCKNTIENRQAKHYGVCKTPGPAKSNGGSIFRKVIICMIIFTTFPDQCGVVTNNVKQYAMPPVLNVSAVAGRKMMAQKSEAAYNMCICQNATNEYQISNIDLGLVLTRAVSKHIHQVLVSLIAFIAAYFICKRNVMSKLHDLFYRLQSWSMFYRVIYETPSIEVESTNEILNPNQSDTCDADQHRKLNQHDHVQKDGLGCLATCFHQPPPTSEHTHRIRNLTHNSCSPDGVVDSTKDGNTFRLIEPHSPVERDTHPTTVLSGDRNHVDCKFEAEIFKVKSGNQDSVQTCSQVLGHTSKIHTRNCKFKSTTSIVEMEWSIPCTNTILSIKAVNCMEIKFEASMTELESAIDPSPVISGVHRTNHISTSDLPTISALPKNWFGNCGTTTSSEFRLLAISVQFSDQQGKFFQECDRMRSEMYALMKHDCSPIQLVISSFFQLEASTLCLCESLMAAFDTHATHTHCLLWKSLIAMTNIANVSLFEDLIHTLRACVYTAGSTWCQKEINQLSNVHSVLNIDDKTLTLTILDFDQRSYLFMLKVKEFSPSVHQDQDIRNASFSPRSLQLALTKPQCKKEIANLSTKANAHTEVQVPVPTCGNPIGPSLKSPVNVKNRWWNSSAIHHIPCADIGKGASHGSYADLEAQNKANIMNISPELSPFESASCNTKKPPPIAAQSTAIHHIPCEDIGKGASYGSYADLEAQNKANIMNISPELSPFESASCNTKKPPPIAAQSNASKCKGEFEKNFDTKKEPSCSKWLPPNSLVMRQPALQLSTVGTASPMSLSSTVLHLSLKDQQQLSIMVSVFSKTPPLIPSQALLVHLNLSTSTAGLCVVHVAEAIPSPPTLQYHNTITKGEYPNCSLQTATIVSQLPTVMDSPTSEDITLLACNLSMVRFHTSSPQHKKEQLLVNMIAVQKVYDGSTSMTIKFHEPYEHKQTANSIQSTSTSAHCHLTLRSSNCVALSLLHKKEQLVSDATCTVKPRFYDGGKRVNLYESCEHEEIADGITMSIAAYQCPTLQPVNCVALSPLPNREPVVVDAMIELRSYKGSKRVNLYGYERKEVADGIAIATNTPAYPHLTLRHVDQIPCSRERAEVTLLQESYCRLQKENLKVDIEHLTPANKRKTTQSHNNRCFNTNGKVRLNKNSQPTVKKKCLPHFSPFNFSAATTVISGTCSQLHAKDTPCQESCSSVEDFSESDTLKSISVHSNSNDTILLKNTDKNRRDRDESGKERHDTKIMTDNSDRGDGAGYLGDRDSESSGDVKLHSTHRKTKKKKKPSTKQRLSRERTAPPIPLFRGISDKPQTETTPYPPASAYIVAGTSTHLRSQPCPVAQVCHVQAHQLLINRHCILQLLLQHCRSRIRRTHDRQEHGTLSADILHDSPLFASARTSIEESSHQHISAIVHGSVLLRPPSQVLQVTISQPFSNQVIEGILSMLPSHATHPDSNVLPSCVYDSGLGASSSISQGRRPQVLLQDDPHSHGSTLAIPIQPRVLEHSNEPNWPNAEGVIELNNDTTDPVSPHSYFCANLK